MNEIERLYASLVNLVPVGIFRTDTLGRVIFANNALLQMAGISGDNLSEELWSSLYHPEDREHVEKKWARARSNGSFAGLIVFRLGKPDGAVIWAQSQVIPALDDEGRLQGYIGVVTDITRERMFRARSEQLSRLYATLSRINALTMQARDRDVLFDAICETIVGVGQFECADIEVADWNSRTIVVAHAAGKIEIPGWYLQFDIDNPELTSVGKLILQNDRSYIFNDIDDTPEIGNRVRVGAKAVGVASYCGMPIRQSGKVVAALNIASSEKQFFSAEILALIEEIAHSVSSALDRIDQEHRTRLAEEAVARSEQHLNTTLRSIGDAVLVTDAAGKVTLMNPVAEALTGWREAEAVGRPVLEVFRIVNEETRATVESPVERVLKEGMVVGLANHTLLIAKDGAELPIADSGAPIRHAERGEINGVVLVFRDQSEEHRMQKALRDSEQLYSTLTDNVPVGVYLADTSGQMRYANARLLEILGLGADELTFEVSMAVIHPDDRERMAEAWHGACARRESTDVGAYRYQYADGSVCWVRGMVTPVFDDHGRLSCLTGFVQDITKDREHLEHIERLSRFNATRSLLNAAIAYSASEQSLYERICNVATEGGFDAAQLYLVDEQHLVARTAAYSDRHYAVLKKFDVMDIGPDALWTPVKEGVRGGRTVVVADICGDGRISQFQRDYARDHGLGGCCIVPLSVFGKVAGVLILYTRGDDLRDAGVLELISDIGRDVSLAMEHLEHEQMRRRTEAELARNEERLRLALTATNVGTYEGDFATGRISMDAVFVRILNLGDMAVDMDIDAVFSLTTAEEKERLIARNDEMHRGLRSSYTGESPVTLPDGTTRWVRHHGVVTAERTPDGKPVRLLGVMMDVTAARMLEERDRLAAKVFDNSNEAITILDAEKRTIVMANQAAARSLSYEVGELLGLDSRLFRSDLHDEAFYDGIYRTVLATGSWQGEMWRKRRTGEAYPALTSLSLVKDLEGKPTYMIMQEIDISPQKEFEQRIRNLAYRDGLTELPNRTLLRDRVEQSIAGAARENGSLVLLFLDLDHFKTINDSLGHAVGDRLLREIAARLTNSIREMDTVGRLGGDEFLVLLPDGDADAAAHVAQKLLEECSRPFKVESHTLTVTPSIGIALYPRDGADFDGLLKSADTAMYRAKDEGRNTYRFYTPEMNQAVFQRMVLESSLRRAIGNKEFVLHYQPKFELRSRKLVGLEALIRWHQPEMGMVSPAQFIPVAEESGLIEVIGLWVIQEACRQAKAWRKAGLPSLRVAVNFSARQFAAGNIVDLVKRTLAATGLPGEMLEVEITESLLAQDMGHTFDVLQNLKRLGMHISVDDFGTGYSSLSYLKRFPIDCLKIDQSFVRDLVTDADDRAIAAAVVTLGHSLGMRVIAEGVETKQQMDILREMGCDEVQGYFLGRPISADEMTQALGDYHAMFGGSDSAKNFRSA